MHITPILIIQTTANGRILGQARIVSEYPVPASLTDFLWQEAWSQAATEMGLCYRNLHNLLQPDAQTYPADVLLCQSTFGGWKSFETLENSICAISSEVPWQSSTLPSCYETHSSTVQINYISGNCQNSVRKIGFRCKKIKRGKEPCGSKLYYTVTPKISLMNEICPKISPLSTSLICPLRIMFIAS